MKLFGSKKNDEDPGSYDSPILVAPMTGECYPINDVSDPVFAQKLLGDGVAILPCKGDVFAPADGEVIQVAQTFQSVMIKTPQGAEILLHLGIDTVSLTGEGFTCFIKEGDWVKAGDKILTMDLEVVAQNGLSTMTPMVISNMDMIDEMEIRTGDVVGGVTPVLAYEEE